MVTEVREYRRAAFDDVALLYDQIRPGYPDKLYKDLVGLSKIPDNGKILEIGAGTGQATLPLAEMGYHITAIELGDNLARVAKDKLKSFPEVEVLVDSFEKWELPSEPYDLVIAATAFHWIDPKLRFEKSAAALKLGGAIGIFGSWHEMENDKEFIDATEPIYNRYMPPKESYQRLAITPTGQELEATGLFINPVESSYKWTATYTANEYIRLINTYSEHRRLLEAQREGLFTDLTELINKDFGGHVTKHYTTRLIVAHKK